MRRATCRLLISYMLNFLRKFVIKTTKRGNRGNVRAVVKNNGSDCILIKTRYQERKRYGISV